MIQPQPNERATGLRIALDMAMTRRAIAGKMNGVCGDLDVFASGGLFQLNQLIDSLSDQLLEAGGFLGDAPEDSDHEECQHCGEITHLSGLVGERANNCPRCGRQVLED